MKKLIYAAGFILAVIALVPSVQAAGSRHDFKAPHIMGGSAIPNNSRFQGGTHRFQVHVQGPAVSELEINLPEDVSIRRGIEIKNQAGQKIPATVSVNNRQATVVFSQPVPPETTLSIEMQGVNTPGYSGIWLYQVSGKMAGLNSEIPLGTVRIQTSGR